MRIRDDESFVDCGAFTGDTIAEFLALAGGEYREIVAVEPDSRNAGALEEMLAALPVADDRRVRVVRAAAGEERRQAAFDGSGTVASAVGSGHELVMVAPLDEILTGTAPTYIKADVEGAESELLRGSAALLREHQPVLAVCLYHRPQDLWAIPQLIHSLAPSYRLYLRRYSDECWETVCYAIPPDRVLA